MFEIIEKYQTSIGRDWCVRVAVGNVPNGDLALLDETMIFYYDDEPTQEQVDWDVIERLTHREALNAAADQG